MGVLSTWRTEATEARVWDLLWVVEYIVCRTISVVFDQIERELTLLVGVRSEDGILNSGSFVEREALCFDDEEPEARPLRLIADIERLSLEPKLVSSSRVRRKDVGGGVIGLVELLVLDANEDRLPPSETSPSNDTEGRLPLSGTSPSKETDGRERRSLGG